MLVVDGFDAILVVFIVRSVGIVIIVVILVLIVSVVRVRQPAELAHVYHITQYLYAGRLQAPGAVLYKRNPRFTEAGYVHHTVYVLAP